MESDQRKNLLFNIEISLLGLHSDLQLFDANYLTLDEAFMDEDFIENFIGDFLAAHIEDYDSDNGSDDDSGTYNNSDEDDYTSYDSAHE